MLSSGWWQSLVFQRAGFNLSSVFLLVIGMQDWNLSSANLLMPLNQELLLTGRIKSLAKGSRFIGELEG